MSERILDLVDKTLYLRCENECLVLEDREGEAPPTFLPLRELGAVILANPALSLSHAVIVGLARHNVLLVACDERRIPIGMLLPLTAHHTQVERFTGQVSLGASRRKRLWQAVVRAKLLAQARCLELLGRPGVGLAEMAARVRSGDPDNVEAQGAQRYWKALFEGGSFRRSREGAPPNNALNYGYAVLRATVARAICGSGLHPSFGLHHHNRYDSFALASDMMEPFRPLVDARVAEFLLREEIAEDLGREARGYLLQGFLTRYTDGRESRTLSDWVLRAAQSLVRAIGDPKARLELPILVPDGA